MKEREICNEGRKEGGNNVTLVTKGDIGREKGGNKVSLL